MRIILMYDLPTLTPSDRRAYRQFNKDLISAGFVHLQNSVYTKLVLNATQKTRYEQYARRQAPAKGSIMLMTVTERQFSQMEFIVGEAPTKVVQTDDRLVLW